MAKSKIDFNNTMDVRKYICERSEVSPSGCWEWTKSLDKRGYGQSWDGKKVFKAHRLSYLAFNGNIPDGNVVMHLCDNPKCVNPYHLVSGTQKENCHDAASKGRLIRAKGEFAYNAKLANSQAFFARRLFRSGVFFHEDLAVIFGVKKSVIADLITRTYSL